MRGRKTRIGIAMVCALLVCAVASANASAAGTTAGECTKNATVKDFTDADCLTSGTGEFGHILFPAATVENITATNTTPFIYEFKIAGSAVKVECTTVSGTGTVTNNNTSPMTLSFGNSTTSFTNCVVLTPANKCSVVVAATTAAESDPMTLGLGEERTGPTGEKVKSYEDGKGTEMGLRFSALSGKPFTTLTFASLPGQTCPAAFTTSPLPVSGSAVAIGGRGGAATSTGATGVFTKASTIGGLLVGGNPATLEGTLTFRKTGGNPATITTTSP